MGSPVTMGTGSVGEKVGAWTPSQNVRSAQHVSPTGHSASVPLGHETPHFPSASVQLDPQRMVPPVFCSTFPSAETPMHASEFNPSKQVSWMGQSASLLHVTPHLFCAWSKDWPHREVDW